MNRRSFRVLVATDGSPQARAALAGTTAFPWPSRARVAGLVARDMPSAQVTAEWPQSVWEALERSLRRSALAARRVLQRRWPDAEVDVVDGPAVEAILTRARRVGARAIVVGSRGHGALGRLVLGSVSRGVVRHAPCAVLVVKGRLREARRLVIGLDGSPNARRAVAFVASLEPARGSSVTLLALVEPVRPGSIGLLPASIRALVTGQAEALEARRVRAARRQLDAAARRLSPAGWRVRADVRFGTPLPELLAAATATRADVLVVGARGIGRVERLLLGSVAEGALTRSPVSVLIVK